MIVACQSQWNSISGSLGENFRPMRQQEDRRKRICPAQSGFKIRAPGSKIVDSSHYEGALSRPNGAMRIYQERDAVMREDILDVT